MPSLLDIDIDIRQKILEYAVLIDNFFKPYYPHCSSFAKEFKVQNENHEISLILVNRQLRSETSQVFYGSSCFLFEKPSIALWWLSHIGAFNRAHLRDIGLRLTSRMGGMANQMDETLWIRALVQLRSESQLGHLHLDFAYWIDDSYRFIREYNQNLYAKRTALRNIFMMEMSKFRALQLEICNNTLMTGGEIRSLFSQVSLPLGQDFHPTVYVSESPIKQDPSQTFETRETPTKSIEMMALDEVPDNFFNDDPTTDPLTRSLIHSDIEVVDLVDVEVSPLAPRTRSNLLLPRANRLSFDGSHQNERGPFEQQSQRIHNVNASIHEPNRARNSSNRVVQAHRRRNLRAPKAERRALGKDMMAILRGGAIAPTHRTVRLEKEVNNDTNTDSPLDSLAEFPWPEEEDAAPPSRPVFQ